MQRAVSFAARLDFAIDPPIFDAIARSAANCAPGRARAPGGGVRQDPPLGRGRSHVPALQRVGLLEPLEPRAARQAGDELWASLARLDAYRPTFRAPPPDADQRPSCSAACIVPLGFSPGGVAGLDGAGRQARPEPRHRCRCRAATWSGIHQVLMLQRRLREPSRSAHARRMLMQRPAFADALTLARNPRRSRRDTPGDFWRERRHRRQRRPGRAPAPKTPPAWPPPADAGGRRPAGAPRGTCSSPRPRSRIAAAGVPRRSSRLAAPRPVPETRRLVGPTCWLP